MKIITFLILLFSLNFLYAQDSSGWPVIRGDRELKGYSSITPPSKLQLKWRFKTGAAIKSTAVIHQDTVFITSTDGSIYALDIRDGKLLWKFDTTSTFEGSALIAGNALIAADMNGTVYCLSLSDGKLRWKYLTDGRIMGSPNQYREPGGRILLLIGSYDRLLHTIDLENGRRIRTYEARNFINGTAAVNDRWIAFGGCDASVHVLDAALGVKYYEADTGSYIAGSVALEGDDAYGGNYAGSVFRVNLVTKKIIWQTDPGNNAKPIVSSPAVHAQYVLIGSRDRHIYALDKSNGKVLWKYLTQGESDVSPVIMKDRVVTASGDGRVYLLDLKTGKRLRSYEIGSSLTASAAVSDRTILIGAQDGYLYCLGER